MFVKIFSEKVNQDPLNDGIRLFSLTPYGQFGVDNHFEKIDILWHHPHETSSPFPPLSVGQLVRYQKNRPVTSVRNLIRMAASNPLGVQLLGSHISLADEPYHRALNIIKNISLDANAVNKFYNSISLIQPHKIERDFTQNEWPLMFGELVWGLEFVAQHLEIEFNKFKVDYDSCIYMRPQLFAHVDTLKNKIESKISGMQTLPDKYYNDIYKELCFELSSLG